MNIDQKIEYNRQSSQENNWLPSWFGLPDDAFDVRLITAIENYQHENELVCDGLLGPSTFRRIYTDVIKSQMDDEDDFVSPAGERKIIYKGHAWPIMWSKVVLWNEQKGLTCRSKRSSRTPKYFINHWDVCLNSKSCARVLKNRTPQLGVHFCIDWDGTIWQLCDMSDIAYHAGGHNSLSIGVEINSAHSLRHADYYISKGAPRPIIENETCHGQKLKPFLGFTADQKRATAALWASVSHAVGIPIQVPNSPNTVDPACASKSFEGFCGHFHVSRRKIDPAGALDFHLIAEMANLIKTQMER